MDLVVVGGGILGLAAARCWLLRTPGGKLLLLEKEARVAAHQTGHNSGVLHSGLYYTPGTQKARNCRRGKALMEAFCEARGVPFRRVGKLVVATSAGQQEALGELEARGREHGVALSRVDAAGIRAIEPAAGGIAGLHLPETAIVDYVAVAEALADEVRELGGELRFGVRVTSMRSVDVAGALGVRLELEGGESLHAKAALVCCGLQADRVARAAGLEPGRAEGSRPALRIVPFLGSYFDLKPEYAARVRGLIYPVPDARFPFLGVHLTRRMPARSGSRERLEAGREGGGRGPQHEGGSSDDGADFDPTAGRVDAGPNAALAFAREGYGRRAGGRFRLRDAASALSWPGTWKLVGRQASQAAAELWRSLSREAFAREAARLVPELTTDWLVPARPGVRAQALGRDGRLVDDYVFAREGAMLHVLNAPSPAATASLAIAEELIDALGWTYGVALRSAGVEALGSGAGCLQELEPRSSGT